MMLWDRLRPKRKRRAGPCVVTGVSRIADPMRTCWSTAAAVLSVGHWNTSARHTANRVSNGEGRLVRARTHGQQQRREAAPTRKALCVREPEQGVIVGKERVADAEHRATDLRHRAPAIRLLRCHSYSVGRQATIEKAKSAQECRRWRKKRDMSCGCGQMGRRRRSASTARIVLPMTMT